MTDYFTYALIGMAIIVVVEAGIWMNACLGLSMKHENASFTDIMLRAPYRPLWPPKVLLAIAQVVLFSVAARYYRTGGKELTLAYATFAGLFFYGLLAFGESVRAIRRYDKHGA